MHVGGSWSITWQYVGLFCIDVLMMMDINVLLWELAPAVSQRNLFASSGTILFLRPDYVPFVLKWWKL